MTASLTRFDGTYSERLRWLTGRQLQAAADRFDLGALLDAQPVRHGLFGQNLFLDTETGRYVLRGVPHVDEEGLDQWQWRTEQFFAELIHRDTNVPAPWPYLIDDETDIFGWSYAIMPRMPGQNVHDLLNDERAPAGRREELLFALGRCAAELKGIQRDECGRFDHRALEFRADERSWRSQVEARINRLLEQVAGFALTTSEDLDWARSILRDNGDALDVEFVPSYVHQDFKANNLTAVETEGRWRVAGLFDLAEGYIGDGELNVVRAIFEAGARGARHIMRGYLASAEARQGFRERFRIYMMEDRLMYWYYGVGHADWFKAPTTFRDTAAHYVKIDPLGDLK